MGLSSRTLKRMIAAGQLEAFRSPGGHLRVARTAVEKFRRGLGSSTPVAASSVLQNKRERIEELGLEVQELRATREIEKVRAEDSRSERARLLETRVQVLTQKRAIQQTRLQREQIAQERDRAQKQQEREQWERSWINGTIKFCPDWLLHEQVRTVIAAVKETLTNYDDGQDGIGEALVLTVNRVVGPWRAEREAKEKQQEAERQATQRRESLIDSMTAFSLFQATDVEKASAITAARTALLSIPLNAGELYVRAAISGAIDPFKQVVERRLDDERSKAKAARAKEEAESQERVRNAQKVFEEQRRQSAKQHLISVGELRVWLYICELCHGGEINNEYLNDISWQEERKAEVRNTIEQEFDGTEGAGAAEELAYKVVDEALDRESED
jgi:excisionase family DNA binding protein